jgi:ABC-type spermidine/putrescine transport system permease subunit II
MRVRTAYWRPQAIKRRNLMERLRTPGLVPLILGFYIFVLYAPVLLLPLFSFNDSIYMNFPMNFGQA